MVNDKKPEENIHYIPICMCLGMSIGTAIGAATNNIALCMSVGLSIGVGVGSILDAKNRKVNQNPSASEDEEAE